MKGNNDYFTGFRFLDNVVNKLEETHEFIIPKEKFKGTSNHFSSLIELFDNNKSSKKYIINIYLCKNIFHLYLSFDGLTYELIFYDEYDFKEMRNRDIGYQFDDNGNKHRMRISLINYNLAKLTIDNFKLIPSSYIPKIENVTNSYFSFQLSIYSRDKIVCKPNELYEPGIDIHSFYEKYNTILEVSYEKLTELFRIGIFNDNKFKNKLITIAKSQIPINQIFNKFNFHKPKAELEIDFND